MGATVLNSVHWLRRSAKAGLPMGLLALLTAAPAGAGVVRIAIESRAAVPTPAPASIAYERLGGRFFGELDPADPLTAILNGIQRDPDRLISEAESSAILR